MRARADASDQKLLLVAEKRVKLTLGRFGARGDFERGRACHSVFGERTDGGVQDALAHTEGPFRADFFGTFFCHAFPPDLSLAGRLPPQPPRTPPHPPSPPN